MAFPPILPSLPAPGPSNTDRGGQDTPSGTPDPTLPPPLSATLPLALAHLPQQGTPATGGPVMSWERTLLRLNTQMRMLARAPRDATPDDVESLMSQLRGHDDWRTCARQLQDALHSSRLRLKPDDLLACVALSLPDRASGVDGLAAFVAAMERQYRGKQPMLASAEAFGNAMVQAVAGSVPPPRDAVLRAFLMRHARFVVPFLVRRLTGVAPSEAFAASLWNAACVQKLGKLADLFKAYRDRLLGVVAGMQRRGLPAHWSELQKVLAESGWAPSGKPTRSLSRSVPEICYEDGWCFRNGQAPLRPQPFILDQPSARVFRGGMPDEQEHAGVQPAAGASGLCWNLLTRHPGGCSYADLEGLLGELTPDLTFGQRSGMLRQFRRAGRLLQVGRDLWSVNPDMLCRDAAEAVLAACPPRAQWPGQARLPPAHPLPAGSPPPKRPRSSVSPDGH